jgi:hypothetical protein
LFSGQRHQYSGQHLTFDSWRYAIFIHEQHDWQRRDPQKMTDIILRFVIGGLFVTAFAVVGDLFKPKTFAGLFGAAPSVALATLALTIAKDGKPFAALEARSMLAGAAALCLYSLGVSRLTMRWRWPALRATLAALVVWFGTAYGLWWACLR